MKIPCVNKKKRFIEKRREREREREREKKKKKEYNFS
jgi:hypothetical protein